MRRRRERDLWYDVQKTCLKDVSKEHSINTCPKDMSKRHIQNTCMMKIQYQPRYVVHQSMQIECPPFSFLSLLLRQINLRLWREEKESCNLMQSCSTSIYTYKKKWLIEAFISFLCIVHFLSRFMTHARLVIIFFSRVTANFF